MSHLVFAILTPFALLVQVGVIVIVWNRRSMAGARALALLAAAGGLWQFFSLLDQTMPTLRLSVWMGQLALVAVAWMSVAWFAFVSVVTGRPGWLRSAGFYGVCALAGVTTVLALTAPHHDLIWTSIVPVERGFGFSDFVVERGAWFWVHAAACWGLVAGGVGRVLYVFARPGRARKRLSLWMVAGAVVPLAFNVAFVFDWIGVEKDFSSLGFVFASAAFAQGLFGYRVLDLRQRARAQLVDSMADGLIAIDVAGVVTDLNPAAEQVAGSNGVLGQPIDRVLPALVEARHAPQGEITLGAGGHARTFAWRADAVERDGRAVGRLVVLRDITERRAAEAALRDALGQLETRNDDLDAFARMVAHDLKSPINGIRGYAQLMDLEGEDLTDELREEAVATILHTSDQMTSIIDELLVLASVRSADVQPERLDMEAIVADVLRRVEPAVQRCQASVEVPEQWPAARGHAPWVAACWTNYLTNAAKYGGPAPRIVLGAEPSGARVRFYVDDSGPGVPPERRADVFAPFKRLHGGEVEGHGLGLSIVQRVTERLGGVCGVEEAPGGGARFWFELPAA